MLNAASDPALDCFLALLDGREVPVERVLRDGRVGVVTIAGDVAGDRGPTALHREILLRVAHGESNKQIALALGITDAAASIAIRRLQARFFLPDRWEVALFVRPALGPGADGAAPAVDVEAPVSGKRFRLLPPAAMELENVPRRVLTWRRTSLPAPAELSTAEARVVEAVLHGHSCRAVARQRGVSACTVANQIQSAFRKLGVHSRGELAIRLQQLIVERPAAVA